MSPTCRPWSQKAPAVLQKCGSAAPASPSAPGWPAGPALGLSGSTAGPAASAQVRCRGPVGHRVGRCACALRWSAPLTPASTRTWQVLRVFVPRQQRSCAVSCALPHCNATAQPVDHSGKGTQAMHAYVRRPYIALLSGGDHAGSRTGLLGESTTGQESLLGAGPGHGAGDRPGDRGTAVAVGGDAASASGGPGPLVRWAVRSVSSGPVRVRTVWGCGRREPGHRSGDRPVTVGGTAVAVGGDATSETSADPSARGTPESGATRARRRCPAPLTRAATASPPATRSHPGGPCGIRIGAERGGAVRSSAS